MKINNIKPFHNNISGVISILFCLGILSIIFLFRNVILGFSKIVITGDYVSFNFLIYLTKYFYLWNPFERLGVFNYNALFYSPLVKLYGLILYITFKNSYAGNIFFITPLLLSYVSMYTFIIYLYKENKIICPIMYILSSLVALYYALNPWVINRLLSGHLYLLYSYSVMPLLLMYMRKISRTSQHNISNLIIFCLLLSFSINGLQTFIIVIIFLIITYIYFGYHNVVNHNNKKLKLKKINIKAVLIVLTTLILILLPWLISLYYMYNIHMYPHEIVKEENRYPWLFRNFNFINIISLRSYWWTFFSITIYHLNSLLRALEITTYSIILFLSAILIKRRKLLYKVSLYAVTLYIVFIALGMLTAYLAHETSLHILPCFVRYWLIIYRDPDKLFLPIPLAYSLSFIIVGALITQHNRIKRRATLLIKPLYILIITFFIVLYTAINPILHGYIPLAVTNLPYPRKYIYKDYNLLQNNILTLPTSQYLVYKWLKSPQPLANLNKYLLPRTTIGPPMDPNYDYSNISLKLLHLQQNIYSGNIFKNSRCYYIRKILTISGIRSIMIQKDVYSYNYKLRKFIEFLNYSCNISLTRLYPHNEKITLTVTFKLINSSLIKVNAILNNKYYKEVLEKGNLTELRKKLSNASILIYHDRTLHIYKIALCGHNLNATSCNVLTNTGRANKKYNVINKTLLIMFELENSSLVNNLHKILAINSIINIYVTPDEKLVIAIKNKIWHDAIFSLSQIYPLEIYRVQLHTSRVFTINGDAYIEKIYKLRNTLQYILNIKSNSNFTLLYHVGYDPLWIASVYKENKFIEKLKPIPIYGLINGFPINESGNITLIITYSPQNAFGIGLRISVATTSLLLIMLVICQIKRKRKLY